MRFVDPVVEVVIVHVPAEMINRNFLRESFLSLIFFIEYKY